MKKLVYLLVLTFGINSCSTDDEIVTDGSQLIGKWNWISTCGGFTGACSYPSEDNYETLEITDSLYIVKRNGVIYTETSYSITDIQERETGILYEIEFENGPTLRWRYLPGHLGIEGGDFWKEYERIEE